jgi:type III secretion protein T
MEKSLDPAVFLRLQEYVLAGAAGTARIGAVMAIFPGFTRLGLSGVGRGVVALVLTLPLIPLIESAWEGSSRSDGEVAALLFKEVIVGTTIGLVLGVPFWAAEIAGSLLDLQRASSLGNLVDPSNVEEANITPTLFALLMLALFYGAGGFLLVSETIYDSYAIWPPQQFLPIFTADAANLFLKLLDQIFFMGIMLVIPMVFILLLADIVLGLVSRAAPHLHVFDLSLSIKNLLIALFLVPYLAFLVTYMERDIGWLMEANKWLHLLAGSKI